MIAANSSSVASTSSARTSPWQPFGAHQQASALPRSSRRIFVISLGVIANRTDDELAVLRDHLLAGAVATDLERVAPGRRPADVDDLTVTDLLAPFVHDDRLKHHVS